MRRLEFDNDRARRRQVAISAAPCLSCPLDFSWAVRRVLQRVQPDLLVLGELELWPQLLADRLARGVPIAVVNARMSERSFRGYRRLRLLARRMLRRLTVVIARSREDADRFAALARPTWSVAGSMKYDGARGADGGHGPEADNTRRHHA